ncbi:class I SAM-dependent methyltransferase [Pseudomonas sp. St29]|uniref:class I SAM-dependent methyltransferase n=1 Tax=Pseudomonas sp. St29 TaxID=1500687 RepID=UPI0005FC437A|nr:class I SAM-dependent methyltransferase [Pseudomonas sp. St29]BAQ80365.1 glycosyltransferase [Pseudomonas sp. St29]
MSLPIDFSAEQYLYLHPDVRLAGIDPAFHYLNWGLREGRPYKPNLDPLLPRVAGDFNADGLRSRHNHDFLSDPRYVEAYARGMEACGSDYQWYWRVHIGLWAARSAAKHSGDFVECGVNYGFLSSAIMKDLDWDSTGKTFYLLDTFSGIDERYLSAQEKTGDVVNKNQKWIDDGSYTSNIDAVRANFSEWKNVKIIQGSIPDTLTEIDSTQIAYLHIDMNCTNPEVAAIEFLWDRLVPGAIILLDDYAYYGYQPQKDGMDRWAAKRDIAIASLPTGQGLLIKP